MGEGGCEPDPRLRFVHELRGMVDIAQLITGVTNALDGCGSS